MKVPSLTVKSAMQLAAGTRELELVSTCAI